MLLVLILYVGLRVQKNGIVCFSIECGVSGTRMQLKGVQLNVRRPSRRIGGRGIVHFIQSQAAEVDCVLRATASPSIKHRPGTNTVYLGG